MNSQIIIVCAETDRDSASQTGLPILRFGLGLTSNGTPIRTIAQHSILGDILCISDFGISQQIPDEIIRQLTEEASDAGGIFADFERAVPQLDSFYRHWIRPVLQRIFLFLCRTNDVRPTHMPLFPALPAAAVSVKNWSAA